MFKIKLLLRMSLLIIMSLTTACQLSNKSEDNNVQSAVGKPKDTVSIVSNDLPSLENVKINNNIISVNATGLDESDPLYNASRGDILAFNVSEEFPKGYLAVVKSVYTQNGKRNIQVRDATIEEAFDDLEINIRSQFLPEDPEVRFIPSTDGAFLSKTNYSSSRKTDLYKVSGNKLIIELKDFVLYGNSRNKILLNGLIELGVEVNFDFSLKNKTMKFSINPTVFEKFSIKGNYDSTELSREIEIGKVSKTFNFIIGGVYVPVTPEFSLSVGANGNVTVDFYTEVSTKASFKAGLIYNNGWEQKKSSKIDYSCVLPTVTGESTLRAYIKPEFNVWLFNSIGPTVSWEPYLKFKSNTVLAFKNLSGDIFYNPEWVLSAGYGINVGCVASIFGFIRNDFVYEIPKDEVILLSSLKPPTGLTAAINTSNNNIDISWEKVESAQNYEVYKSKDKITGFVLIGQTTSNKFSDSAAIAGETYYYRVKSKNNDLGLSPPSDSVSSKAGDDNDDSDSGSGSGSGTSGSSNSAPSKPTNLKVEIPETGGTYGQNVKVSWSPSTDTDKDIIHYYVVVTSESGKEVTMPKTTSNFLVFGVNNSTTYKCKVIAKDYDRYNRTYFHEVESDVKTFTSAAKL